jgi:hypothetical protein
MLLRTCAVLLCTASTAGLALAEELTTATDPLPRGTFTTWDHSDQWKIKNALAAAPDFISAHATVVDWVDPRIAGKLDMGRVLRKGTNGWTCMPDIPGRPQHDPMCADEPMMEILMDIIAGRTPTVKRVGLSYMLLGEARQGQGAGPAKDPREVKEWFYIGPHIMVALPAESVSALDRINQDLKNGLPYTSLLNPKVNVPIWVIPVRSGDRIHQARIPAAKNLFRTKTTSHLEP